MSKAIDFVKALEAALRSNVSVKQVTVDGQTITFADRASMLAELDYWERKAARQSGKRRLTRGIDISSVFGGNAAEPNVL